MKLTLHKNITASVTLDNTKMFDHGSAAVYGNIEKDGDLYLFIKDSNSGRSMKIHIKEYAKEVEQIEDI